MFGLPISWLPAVLGTLEHVIDVAVDLFKKKNDPNAPPPTKAGLIAELKQRSDDGLLQDNAYLSTHPPTP